MSSAKTLRRTRIFQIAALIINIGISDARHHHQAWPPYTHPRLSCILALSVAIRMHTRHHPAS